MLTFRGSQDLLSSMPELRETMEPFKHMKLRIELLEN